MPRKKTPLRSSVYVRINPAIRDELDRFLETRDDSSLTIVIQQLLVFFLALPPSEQTEVINGRKLGGWSELVEQFAWASHSFEKRSWNLAAKEFSELGLAARAIGANGFARLAMYKEAYCWLDIGSSARNTAIKQNDASLMRKAREAVIRAIQLNKRHDEEQRQRPILY